MKNRKFKSYINTDINWIKELPSHWKVVRIGRIFKNVGSGTTPKKTDVQNFYNGSIAWIQTSDLNDSILQNCNNKVTTYALRNCKSLKIYPKNSIIIAMYGSTVGKVSITEFPATVNQACCVLPPSNNCESKYIFYCLRSIKEFLLSMAMGGAQRNIKQELIKSLKIPLPTRIEQVNIYKYLDKEVSKINLLVAKEKDLIRLLQDKKSILISESITKGISQNTEMKDSGIEFIGEIPIHWKLIKLSRLCTTQTGKRPQKLTKAYCSSNKGIYPVYSGQTERNGVMAYINDYEFDVGNEGVILSTTVGENAMNIKTVKGRFSLSQNCMIILGKDNSCHTKYLEYCFSSIFNFEKRKLQDHMQKSFRKEDFNQIKVPIPPLEEQSIISNHLTKEIVKINKIINLSRLFISKLILKRDLLIFKAVTGEIEIA